MQIESLPATLARIATLAAPVAAALALAACASKPIEAPAPAPVATAAPTHAAPAPAPMAAPPVATPLPAYLDPNSEISQKRSVFFAFDQSTFNDQDKAIVELQGRYLARHPDIHITVAGNTDERGGSEYNLALGQKRAEAVAKSLTLLGVNASQVEATSFGKERPVDTGHNEAAWAKNRRVDLKDK